MTFCVESENVIWRKIVYISLFFLATYLNKRVIFVLF